MVGVQQLRILLADDSDIVRRHLRDLLAPLTHIVIIAEADTADRTVELVAQQSPDVVVLDIEMPGSGLQALKKIKKTYPQVRVIMLTNHAGPYYRKICLRAGADFFLDKSMEFEQVPGVLKSIAAA